MSGLFCGRKLHFNLSHQKDLLPIWLQSRTMYITKFCTAQALLTFLPSNHEKPSALTPSFDLASLYAKLVSLVCVTSI